MTRLSVNMNEETTTALREIMASEGRNATNLVMRAILTYKLLLDEQKKGSTIFFEDTRGNYTDVTLL